MICHPPYPLASATDRRRPFRPWAALWALCACPAAAGGWEILAAESATPPLQIERGQLRVPGLDTPPGFADLPYRRYWRGQSGRPTVFFLGGGPGISNLKFTPPNTWLEDFDVILLEYRGVGEASPILASDHFATALKMPLPRLGLEEAAPMQAQFRAGFAELRQRGVVFDDFSINRLADDIDALRRQLGLDRIHLVGHSFGTRIALDYQTRYRSAVAASILFAMNPPGGFVWYPEQTQRVWQRYRAALLARGDTDLGTALARMLEHPGRRAEQWGPLAIDDTKALMVAFFLSYNQHTRHQAFAALDGAENGHTLRWWSLGFAYNWMIRFGFNWADFFVKAYTADCRREDIARADRQGRDALFQSPSAVLFSAIDAFEAAGGRCPGPAMPPDYRHTLAVIGEFDPSTPLESLPAEFPREHLVTVAGAGHADVLYGNDGATGRWLRRFFLETPSFETDLP
jgi:pimeloyl-ACP methyl ester carboxylesterase